MANGTGRNTQFVLEVLAAPDEDIVGTVTQDVIEVLAPLDEDTTGVVTQFLVESLHAANQVAVTQFVAEMLFPVVEYGTIEVWTRTAEKEPSGKIEEEFADYKLVPFAGTERLDNYQLVGTTAEAVLIGDVETCGWCHLKNLDLDNSVFVRMGASGTEMVEMKPHEASLFRLAANDPYIRAENAACRVRVRIFED